MNDIYIKNRKAGFNFELLDTHEAGIVLTGMEVKSIKSGRASLGESYVRIMGDELWLINAHIPLYTHANAKDYDPSRSRKLLMHKKEIRHLAQKMETKNLTLVPTAVYVKHGKVKVGVALARGKKEFEKREKIKRRDLEREKQRTLKSYK